MEQKVLRLLSGDEFSYRTTKLWDNESRASHGVDRELVEISNCTRYFCVKKQKKNKKKTKQQELFRSRHLNEQEQKPATSKKITHSEKFFTAAKANPVPLKQHYMVFTVHMLTSTTVRTNK